MKSPILVVENLSARYEGRNLLQQISFELSEGEILCLLGPSGSGKTTLLRLIAGLESEIRGRVLFRGRDMHDVPPHRRNFGMMFQEYALFPHKNVSENIAFGLEMQKLPPSAVTARVAEMLELVGLEAHAAKRIDEVSGGERQRVALARSLAPKPELLLLDEPLGSLDRSLRDRLAGDIREILNQLDVTAIFVTHDQTEAFGIADKVAILENSHLQQIDRPEIIYRKPATASVAAFLGFKNILQGTLFPDNTFACDLGRIALPPVPSGQHSASQPATLLILPEGGSLRSSGSPDETSISGTVKTKTFLGGCYRMRIEVRNKQLSFDIPNIPEPPSAGEEITLFIARDFITLISDPRLP